MFQSTQQNRKATPTPLVSQHCGIAVLASGAAVERSQISCVAVDLWETIFQKHKPFCRSRSGAVKRAGGRRGDGDPPISVTKLPTQRARRVRDSHKDGQGVINR